VSREAVNFVLRRSQTKGNQRLIMLSMALHCAKEKTPYLIRIKAKQLAEDANITQRYAQQLVKELDESGELDLIDPGVGRRPSLYEICCRSYVSQFVSTSEASS
jgi:hypothetical protein